MRRLFMRLMVLLLTTALFLFAICPAFAQEPDPLVTPPPNVVLPNANGVPLDKTTNVAAPATNVLVFMSASPFCNGDSAVMIRAALM